MSPTLLRLQVLDNGWHPLPVFGKQPAVERWQRYCRTAPSADDVASWEQHHRTATNTGSALGRQVVIDIDVVSDPLLARRLRAEAVAVFGPTPFVRVGRAPKLALVYRPRGLVTTRHFKAASGNGDGIDILSDGTQFVIYGRHPETRREYEWIGGASPLFETPDEAPEISADQVEEFLDRAHRWMPLAGATAGKRPTGTGGAQPIVRGPSGLVIDGREVFPANCIWRAAGQLDKAGEPLSADAIAALGWSYFTDRTDGADLGDGKWTERHALHKARGSVRRLRNGAVKLRQVEGVLPTYPDRAKPVHEARQAVDEAIEKHLEAGDAFHAAEDPEAEPPVHAIKVATGVGKTRAVAKAIAERRKARGKGRPYLVAVPHHRLSDELAADFGQHGITARVFRGRSAPDPDRSGKAMCDDLDAVQIALDLGATVETACCRSKDPKTKIERRCAFYSSCAYQRQKTERPDVWIVAHQLLFTAQRAIGEVEGVIIDEGFWQAGVWTATRGLTLDEIEAQLPFGRAGLDDVVNDLEPLRTKLARALRGQENLGGVARRHLVAEGLTTDDCTKAIALEWRLKERTPIYPGMPAKARREAAKAAKGAKHIRAYDRTWRTVRDLLRQDNPDAVSGRLTLAESETEHGVARVVRTQGARPIAAQWRAPTLLMDATLPAPEILKAFYPGAEVLADIEAAMPHVTVRQVLGAPVSAGKLIREGESASRNLKAVRRAILHRHLELDRAPTLVIAQKAVAEWLRASGLPKGITVEWFNNVAGLDRYKGVRLLISVGRILPDVFTVEGMAGALTGLEPVKTKQPDKGPRWFERVVRGVRLKGGGGVAVNCDQHPDPVAEAVRWQICEGELLQAIGRARGVNRTAETPLAVDILADVVLPVTVDRVVPWNEVPAGAEVEMLADGVWLDSPSDMAKCWPAVWETEKAAEYWRSRFTHPKSPIKNTLYKTFRACGRYQMLGERQKWRTARFDLSIVPDPEAWLTERLGLLAGFDLTLPELVTLDHLFDAAAEAGRASSPSERKFDAKQPTRMECVAVGPSEPPPPCDFHGWTRRSSASGRQ